MVPVLGRYAGLMVAGLVGLVVLGPLAAFAPLWGALALAVVATAAAVLAQGRAIALRARCDKLSGEVDLLSRRLLQVEAAARPGPADVQPEVRAEIEELSIEIGLLSGIVRDLTAVVTSQDGEIAGLKAMPAPTPAPIPVPLPAPRAVTPPQPAAPEPRQIPDPPPRAAAIPAPREAPTPREALTPREAAAPADPAPLPARPIPPRPPEPEAPAEAEIVAAFVGEGLEIHLQPVVALPQRKVVAYEALARLRVAGRLAEPGAFLPALERHGRTTELDRWMIQRAATVVRHLARRGSATTLTYGLSPLSLFEPGFLRELARITADDPALAGLAIALPQASWRGLDAGQRALLAPLRGRIGFSLDRPADLRFDAAELAGCGVGQVKVPAGMLLRPEGASLSDIAVEDIVPALGRAGIRLVATAVEIEADVPDLIDIDVPFAQGTVFAAPRPVRAEVLATPPDAPLPPPAEPQPERRPFRSILRRAM